MDNAELTRYLVALNSDDPFGHLVRLIIELKKAGGTEAQAREYLHEVDKRSGAYDADDGRHESILDVLDCVGGWCSQNNHIFARDFDEKRFYRKLPPVT